MISWFWSRHRQARASPYQFDKLEVQTVENKKFPYFRQIIYKLLITRRSDYHAHEVNKEVRNAYHRWELPG